MAETVAQQLERMTAYFEGLRDQGRRARMEEREFPKGERTTMERGAPRNTARRSAPEHPGSVRTRRAVNGADERPGPVSSDESRGGDEDGE